MGPDERHKFVDDLTVLEIINLILVGLTSVNVKHQVPSDIPDHGQFIPPHNFKSQEYLNKINTWTTEQKMKNKAKLMIFNFTNNYQFTTRLQLNHINVEGVTEAKQLTSQMTLIGIKIHMK